MIFDCTNFSSVPNSILCIKSLQKILQYHAVFKDVYREVGMLEVLITCLHRFAALLKDPHADGGSKMLSLWQFYFLTKYYNIFTYIHDNFLWILNFIFNENSFIKSNKDISGLIHVWYWNYYKKLLVLISWNLLVQTSFSRLQNKVLLWHKAWNTEKKC
jgi:hypothetical protein